MLFEFRVPHYRFLLSTVMYMSGCERSTLFRLARARHLVAWLIAALTATASAPPHGVLTTRTLLRLLPLFEAALGALPEPVRLRFARVTEFAGSTPMQWLISTKAEYASAGAHELTAEDCAAGGRAAHAQVEAEVAARPAELEACVVRIAARRAELKAHPHKLSEIAMTMQLQACALAVIATMPGIPHATAMAACSLEGWSEGGKAMHEQIKGKWSPEDDAHLVEVIRRIGHKPTGQGSSPDWVTIASHFTAAHASTGEQCRSRWESWVCWQPDTAVMLAKLGPKPPPPPLARVTVASDPSLWSRLTDKRLTPEIAARIIQAIRLLGHKPCGMAEWHSIAKLVNATCCSTGEQCRGKWDSKVSLDQDAKAMLETFAS